MAAESRTIQAVVEIETIDLINEMASEEKRSFSNMVAVLLEEAVNGRVNTSKPIKKSEKQLS